MPELPEVQTFVNHLKPLVCNQLITDVSVRLPKLLKNVDIATFRACLINNQIKTIERLGKYILFYLQTDQVLVVHLRMEGKLFVEAENSPYDSKHTHILISFANKTQLRYNDTRKFGTFHLFTVSELANAEIITKIALDPLQDGFSGKYLAEKIAKKSIAIKTALLDQTNVAGIGNIYADEICFACKILPSKPANQLNSLQYEELAFHAERILHQAVLNKGTTIHSYKYNPTETGSSQQFLKVHTRVKQSCFDCQSEIVKIKLNGRGTYFCPHCQK